MLLNDIICQLEEKHGVTAGCAIMDAKSGEMFADHRRDLVFKSASLIKTPIMLCALEEVEKGSLSLDTIIPVQPCHCVGDEAPVIQNGTDVPLSVLLEYMITESNNSATNVLIDYLGMDRVNDLSKRMGLKDTILRRHMLDYEAARQGNENRTSAEDMLRLYAMLYQGETLTPFQCETSLPILLRQKDKELLMFANPEQKAAHKTGGLADIAHDAGILYGEKRTLIFAALCTAPDERQCVALLQDLSRQVFALLSDC
ncbi:MAG: serine hydrolase [Clostridia bacterium]|nr:serine hydrolase [Clostridia bacterium]